MCFKTSFEFTFCCFTYPFKLSFLGTQDKMQFIVFRSVLPHTKHSFPCSKKPVWYCLNLIWFLSRSVSDLRYLKTESTTWFRFEGSSNPANKNRIYSGGCRTVLVGAHLFERRVSCVGVGIIQNRNLLLFWVLTTPKQKYVLFPCCQAGVLLVLVLKTRFYF